MKNTKWLAAIGAMVLSMVPACAQAPAMEGSPAPAQASGVSAVPTDLSPAAVDVVKLAEAGMGDDVILSYIQNSQAAFNLSADDVLYLKDLGLSSQVISAMLNHDSALRNNQQSYSATVEPPAAPAAPEPVAPVQPAPAAAPVYVSSPPAEVSYFYNDLSPYGTWVQLEGYGWCWQPRAVVINSGWQPYCTGGHWTYTTAGWYWQSDYSWGWAPFHYGRWCLHSRCGWVWLPDTVWGPAWVTWRTAGDYCGWAPLPPHAVWDVRLGWRFNGVSVGVGFDFGLGSSQFAFVALNNFTDHDLGHRRLPPGEVTRIYKQTTVINNYSVNNNLVVNHGIAVDRVVAATHTQIHEAAIRDLPSGSSRGARTQSTGGGGSIIYRPRLTAPTKPVTMVAEKVDAQHPVVQHAPIMPKPAAYRTTTTGGEGSARAMTPRVPQAETPKASSRPMGEKPASTPQNYSTPKSDQAAQGKVSSPATTRIATESKPAARSMPAYSSGAPSYPLGAAGGAQPASAQDRFGEQNTHIYYPKTYQQAPAAHASPPASQQEAPAHVSPPANQQIPTAHTSPPESARQTTPYSSPANSDDTRQKKN